MTTHARSTHLSRVRLGTARWVSIRPIDEFDRPALSDLYAGLSGESTRRRFLTSTRMSEEDVERLAAEDGLVGVLRAPDAEDGAIVAHAAICRESPGRAEAAFVVADRLQGRGIGRALVRAALEHARRDGLREVAAITYPENRAMRRLLLDAGVPVVADGIDAGVEEIVLRVSGASPEAALAR